jgi:hypothetical protein
MKHWVLNEHTSYCIGQSEKAKETFKSDEFKKLDSFTQSYLMQFSHKCRSYDFLFYHNTSFYLVTYNVCSEYGDKYDLYKTWLDQIIGSKKHHVYDIDRGERVDQEFKEMRLRGIKLKKYIKEVNYVYCNAINAFCLSAKIPFLTALFNHNELTDNYNSAKKYLSESGLNYLIEELDELYRLNNNRIELSEYESIKSTDHLIKQITKEINK